MLIATLLLLLPGDDVADPAETLTMFGFVRDIDGEPIAGAQIRGRSGPTRHSEKIDHGVIETTDETGAYVVSHRADQTLWLRVTAEGFLSRPLPTLSAGMRSNLADGYDATMHRGRRVRLRIVDGDGRAAAGISLVGASGPLHSAYPKWGECVSDEAGVLTTPLLGPGPIVFQFSGGSTHAGPLVQQIDVPEVATDEPIATLACPPATTVTIEPQDFAETARIYVSSVGTIVRSRGVVYRNRESRTHDFSSGPLVMAVPKLDAGIRVFPDGSAGSDPAPSAVVLTGSSERRSDSGGFDLSRPLTLSVRRVPASQVSGRVLFAEPVAEASIGAGLGTLFVRSLGPTGDEGFAAGERIVSLEEWPSNPDLVTADVDASGAYSLSLPYGRYEIGAHLRGKVVSRPLRREVTVEGTSEQLVLDDWQTGPPPPLTGRVVAAGGASVAGAVLTYTCGWSDERTTQSDRDGRFRLNPDGLRPSWPYSEIGKTVAVEATDPATGEATEAKFLVRTLDQFDGLVITLNP